MNQLKAVVDLSSQPCFFVDARDAGQCFQPTPVGKVSCDTENGSLAFGKTLPESYSVTVVKLLNLYNWKQLVGSNYVEISFVNMK